VKLFRYNFSQVCGSSSKFQPVGKFGDSGGEVLIDGYIKRLKGINYKSYYVMVLSYTFRLILILTLTMDPN